MNFSPNFYYHITPHSIEDRAYWHGLRENPRHAAPARPPIPLATDYLAAKRRVSQ